MNAKGMSGIEAMQVICSTSKSCNECIVKDICDDIRREIPNNWSESLISRLRLLPDLIEEDIARVIEMESDSVNHPSHYCQNGAMECIDEMVEVFGMDAVKSFCLCNVWKYRKRAMYKNGKEDLEKSDWYMKKYVELKDKLKDRDWS